MDIEKKHACYFAFLNLSNEDVLIVSFSLQCTATVLVVVK